MLNSILNYQFFKSYRLPIRDNDLVRANICVKGEVEFKKCLNVQIESINLSGINFITDTKFKEGDEIEVYLYTKRIFNNWDFHLKGKIVRSFVYEKDLEKIVYGVLIDRQEHDSVLNYFLKDFIGRFKKQRLKDHLFRACTLDRKLYQSEGVELFSLFQSLCSDISKMSLDYVLQDIAKSFSCENYHIFMLDESKTKLMVEKTNSNIEHFSPNIQAHLLTSIKNNTLLNMSFNSRKLEDENEIHNILAYPIYNRLQRNIGIICLTNTNDKTTFSTFSETNLRMIGHIVSRYYQDTRVNYIKGKDEDRKVIYDNFLGQSKESLELKHSLEIIKDTNKNIMILGERGTKKHEISQFLHFEGRYSDKEIVYIDFNSLDKIQDFFDDIENFKVISNSTIVINEVFLLTKEQQTTLFDILKDRTARIVTLTTKEIYHHVKIGDFSKRLYFLLADIYMHLSPLRNRKNDILEMASEMLKLELKNRELEDKPFSKESIVKMSEYLWPGNMTELRNTIKKSVIKCADKPEIQVEIKNMDREKFVPNKNKFLFKLLESLAQHSDKSINYKIHSESLKHSFNKNKAS